MSRIFTLQKEGNIWLGRKYTTYDGLILRCLTEYSVGVKSVCFNSSGSYFSSVDDHGKVVIFDINRNYYHTIPKVRVLPSSCGVAFSPLRENEVVLPLKSFQCCVLDLTAEKIFKYLEGGHTNPIIYISYSLNGKSCITCSSERIVVWNSKNFDKLKTLVFPEPIVQALFTKNLLLVMTKQTFNVVNVQNYEIIHKMDIPDILPTDYKLTTFDISQDEELLIAGGKGLPICILWDFKGNRVMKLIAFPEMEEKIKKVKFHPLSETNVFVLTERGKIYEVAIPSLEILSGFSNICTWIDDFDVSVHDVERNEYLTSTISSRNHLYKITNNNYLVCALRNGGIHMYNLDTVRKHNQKLRSFESGSTEIQYLREWKPGFYQRYQENTEIDLRKRSSKYPPTNLSFQKRKKKVSSSKTLASGTTLAPQGSFGQSDQGGMIFQYERVKDMLLRNGKFAPQYRKLIWQYLTSMPTNQHKYKSLLGMGSPYKSSISATLRPFFTKRQETATIYRRLEKLLTILSNVGPVFALTETTAEVCYPLLQVFHHDVFFCMEFVLTFFHNWGKRWFEFYPNPPISVMNMVEHLLQVYDDELLEHFKENRITPRMYCWEIMKNLFTEIFSPKDWLCVMDHILTFSRTGTVELGDRTSITGSPMFLYYFVIGFLKYHRETLLQTRSLEGFDAFFHSVHGSHKKSIKPEEIEQCAYVKEIIEIVLSLPPEPGLEYMDYRVFNALPKGEYPLFNLYPKYQVNYQLNRRGRILEEEKRIYRREKERVGLARKELQAKERMFQKKIRDEEQRRRNLGEFKEEQQQRDFRQQSGFGPATRMMKKEMLKTPVPRARIPKKSHVSLGSTVRFRPSQVSHPSNMGRTTGLPSVPFTASSEGSSVMTNPIKDTINLPSFPVLQDGQVDSLSATTTNTFQRIRKSEEEDMVERKMEAAEQQLQKLQKKHNEQVFKRRKQNYFEERFRKQEQAIRQLKEMTRHKDKKLDHLQKQLGVLKKHKNMEKIWEINNHGKKTSPPLNRSRNYDTSRILTGEKPSARGYKMDNGRRRKMMRSGKKTIAEKIRIKRMRENERKRKILQNRLGKLENKVGIQRSLLHRLELERNERKKEERRKMKMKLKKEKLRKQLEKNQRKRDVLKKKRKKIRMKSRRSVGMSIHSNHTPVVLSRSGGHMSRYSSDIRSRTIDTVDMNVTSSESETDTLPTPEKTTSSSSSSGNENSEDVITTTTSSPTSPPEKLVGKSLGELPSSISQARISEIKKRESRSTHTTTASTAEEFQTPPRISQDFVTTTTTSSTSSSPQRHQREQDASKELNLSKDEIKKKFEEFIEKRKKTLHEQTSQIPELSWMQEYGSTSSSSKDLSSDDHVKMVNESLSDDDDDEIGSPLDTPTSSANSSIISTEDLSLSELSEDTMRIVEEVVNEEQDNEDEDRKISEIMNGKIHIPIEED